MRIKPFLFAMMLVSGVAAATETDSAAPTPYERMLAEVRGLPIPERVEVLIRLAWPEGPVDEEVAAVARSQLLGYGPSAQPGLRRAMLTASGGQQADLLALLIENHERTGAALTGEFSLALDQALWFGGPETKRLAMKEAARRRHPFSVLPIIDAAVEYPELTEDAVECLGRLGVERARFFLGDLLRDGSETVRLKAAVALSRIGGSAREPLREAALSEERELRSIAIQALLSSATPDDLYVFHDFVARHAEDDPKTAEAVRAIAVQLEEFLARQQPAEDP